MMRWLDGFIHSMDMSLSKLRDTVKDCLTCSPLDHIQLDITEQQNNNNKNLLKTKEMKKQAMEWKLFAINLIRGLHLG